jgi:hypothetical protein
VKAMKKAQSILEYVIMLTVIVAAIILASGGLGGKIQTGRNGVADSVGRSFGLTPSLRPIPTVTPPITNTPPPPVVPAQVTIPTSVYLTPQQIRDLTAVGIMIGGRSNYDPADKTIEVIGTLTAAQQAVVDRIQREVRGG